MTDDRPLDADDVVQRLCRLQSAVAKRLGYQSAADCFCGHSGFWPSAEHPDRDYDGTWAKGYRNDGMALRFIEWATHAALDRLAEDAPEMALAAELPAGLSELYETMKRLGLGVRRD